MTDLNQKEYAIDVVSKRLQTRIDDYQHYKQGVKEKKEEHIRNLRAKSLPYNYSIFK